MALADLHTLGVARHQGTGDAQVVLFTQQVVGVVKLEREADDGRHRCQRDVALVEGQAHAQCLLALPGAFADHTHVRNRAGVRAGIGTSQPKAGDLLAGREPWQVVILLLLGAVVKQQLGRPQ